MKEKSRQYIWARVGVGGLIPQARNLTCGGWSPRQTSYSVYVGIGNWSPTQKLPRPRMHMSMYDYNFSAYDSVFFWDAIQWQDYFCFSMQWVDFHMVFIMYECMVKIHLNFLRQLLLHLWVMVVLLTYSPEIHSSSDYYSKTALDNKAVKMPWEETWMFHCVIKI